jgi:peptidoglycan-associated lipoprotein
MILAAAALFAACATTKPAQKSGLAKDNAGKNAGASEGAPAAPATDVTEASLRTGGFAARDDLKSVPFDYDSAKLSDDALAALKANAEIIKADPSVEVLVAGHCDQRGTTAYNLALGQKRAKEVRDYYVNLGVDGARVATISYGKEQPLCSDSADECWSKNRRAETLARGKAAESAPAESAPAEPATAQPATTQPATAQ